MRRRSTAVIAVLSFSLLTHPAAAQTAGPASSDPARLGELAADAQTLGAWLVQHSRDAAAAAARVAQAEALVGSARLRPNLQVGAGIAGFPVGPTNPPGIGIGQSLNYGATVSQLFEIHKRPYRIAGASYRLASQQHVLTDTLAGTFAEARAAIARVLYLKSRQTTLQDGLDTARQIVELQRTRFERGDLSGIDFDRLQLDTQTLESDLAQNRADYIASLSDCASLLFAPCDPGSASLDALTPQLSAGQSSLPADWETRIAERADIRALQAAQAATKEDVTLALKRRVPDPIVSVGFTRDRFVISGNNPRVLQMGVTIPIATSDRGQYDAARATAEGRELQESASAITIRAKAEAQALSDRQAQLGATVDLLRTGALARADTILQSTSAAVTQGELSTTDLLLARRARTDIALRIMDLQFQQYLAQNELRHVLGLDTPVLRTLQEATWPSK